MTNRKQFLKARRKQRIISLHTHLGHSKGEYAKAGVFKQHLIRTNESRSINCPVSRFTARTTKESRIPYKFNKRLWRIDERPQEWVRLNYRDVNAIKVITKQQYL